MSFLHTYQRQGRVRQNRISLRSQVAHAAEPPKKQTSLCTGRLSPRSHVAHAAEPPKKKKQPSLTQEGGAALTYGCPFLQAAFLQAGGCGQK